MNVFRNKTPRAPQAAVHNDPTEKADRSMSRISKGIATAALATALVLGAAPGRASGAAVTADSYVPVTTSVLDVVPYLQKDQSLFAGVLGKQYDKPGDGYLLEFYSTSRDSIGFKVYADPKLYEDGVTGSLMGKISLPLGKTININPVYSKQVNSSDAMPPAGTISVTFSGVKMRNGVPGAAIVFGYTAPTVYVPVLSAGAAVKPMVNSETVIFGTTGAGTTAGVEKGTIVAAHAMQQSADVALSVVIRGSEGKSYGESIPAAPGSRDTYLSPAEGAGVSVSVGKQQPYSALHSVVRE